MKIDIYTDGSCIGNPGPGGWAALILFDGQEHEISGSAKDTTNNRMEMTAIFKALRWLHDNPKLTQKALQGSSITIHSDSNLIIQTMNQGWKRKANTDLWAKIDQERAWLPLTWKWVKAHHINVLNNRVDELAQKAAKKA